MRSLIPLLLVISWCTAAEQNPLLSSSGLPAGPSEQLLPAGAVLHARLNSLGQTLDAIDTLVMSFVPTEAVPPQLRSFLKQPKPVLAFAGSQTIGQPITPELISAMLGIASDRPLSLTIYPQDPATNWVLSIPMAEPQALTQLIMNLLQPRQFEAKAIGGKNGWQVVGTNHDLPERCFIVCSDTTAYLCGNERIAGTIASGAGKKLADDSVLNSPEQALSKGDLSIAISTAAIKPMIAMAASQVTAKAPQILLEGRRNLLRSMKQDDLIAINRMLRWNFGISSLEVVLDICECALGTTAEIGIPELAALLQGFDGITLSFDLDGSIQRATVSVHSRDLDPAQHCAPLPMAEISEAVSALPGDRNFLMATGKSAVDAQSPLFANWLKRFTEKLTAKGVPVSYATAFDLWWAQRKHAPRLEQKVPWTLSAIYQGKVEHGTPKTLAEFFTGLTAVAVQPPMTMFPAQPADFLGKHFTEVAAAENANQSGTTTLLQNTIGDSRWFDVEARFSQQPGDKQASRLVYETVYRSRNGLFGYSQHEWINRMIWDAAISGTYQILQPVQGSRPSWLASIDTARPVAVPAAIKALLARVDDGSNSLQIVRVLPILPQVLNELSLAEAVAHREIDDYLAAVRAIIAANKDDGQKLVQKLAKVDFPMLVSSLNIDPASKEIYCVLPGDLRYPRPPVTPILRTLLADFLKQVDDSGGILLTTRVEPGRCSMSYTQDSSALARLVTTSVNAFFRSYMSSPDGMAKLQSAIGVASDGMPNEPETVILYNLTWKFD
jgi:hypothetical protein